MITLDDANVVGKDSAIHFINESIDFSNDTIISKDISIKDGHNVYTNYQYLSHWRQKCSPDSVSQTTEQQQSATEIKMDEMDLLISTSWLRSSNVSVFLNSMSRNEPLYLTEFDNTSLITASIVLLSSTIICLLALCFHHNCLFQREHRKIHPKVTGCCCGFISILLVACILVFIFPLRLASSVHSSSEDMLCEATRIPHSLVQGPYDTHYFPPITQDSGEAMSTQTKQHPLKIESKQKNYSKSEKIVFLGINTLLKLTNQFLGHSIGLSYDAFREDLEKILKVQLSHKIEQMVSTENDFFEDFRTRTINDGTGTQQIPSSISSYLSYFHSFMHKSLPKYSQLGKRIGALQTFYDRVSSQGKFDQFVSDLTQLDSQLKELEDSLLTFWNDLIRGAFSKTENLKPFVVVLLLLAVLVFLSGLLLSLFYCRSRSRGRLEYIGSFRTVIFLNLGFLIVALVLYLQVLRVTFTAAYGCSLIIKLKENDVQIDSSIEGQLHVPFSLQKLLDLCLLTPNPDPPTPLVTQSTASSLLNWFQNEESSQNLREFVGFGDAFKALLQDWNYNMQEIDKSSITDFIQELEALQSGATNQFKSVDMRLDLLNQYLNCTDWRFELETEQCSAKTDDKKCLTVAENDLPSDSCISDQAKPVYENLREHSLQSRKLLRDMMTRLKIDASTESVLYKFSRVWQYIEFAKEELNRVNQQLRLEIRELAEGDLKLFLNCDTIKNDLSQMFVNLCWAKLADLMGFVDLVGAVLLVELVILSLLYLVSCFNVHYEPEPKKKLTLKKEIEREYYQNKNTKVILRKPDEIDDSLDEVTDDDSDGDIYLSGNEIYK